MPIRVEKGKDVVQQVRHWTRGPLVYQGTSAAIYEGTDHDSPDEQKIAVKSVPLQDSKALRSITNEKKMLEKLSNCPNVIQFLGTSISDNVKEMGDKRTMNLLLEYLPRGNLHKLLQSCEGQKLSEPVCKRIARDIVQALSYMHRIGVVHTNINASKVLRGDGCFKLCGFGLSCDFKNTGKNMSKWMKDPHLESGHQQKVPENFFKQKSLSPAVDIFLLGCLVCEILTGRRARVHDSSTLGSHENHGSKALSDVIVEIPKSGWETVPDAHDFVTKCLIKSPRTRWRADQLLNHPWIENIDDLTLTVEMNRLHTLSFWSKNQRTRCEVAVLSRVK